MRVGINGRFLAARPTGVQRFAHEIARRLPDRIETTLFVPGGNYELNGLSSLDVQSGRLQGVAWEQVELPLTAQRAGVDVLLHLANAAPRFGGPHVQVLHDLTPLTRPDDFGAAYRLWVRWAHAGAARSSRALVTVSERSAAEISRVVGVPRTSIQVVRQGVAPLDAPASEADVAAVRARHGLPERYFLAAGPGDPRKGLGLLEQAFGVWAEQPGHADIPALAVVGHRYKHVHREPAGSLAMRLLGHVSDYELRALYTGAIAFLFPSEDEGFGRSPLEALACGTRVLATPYAAVSEVLGPAVDVVVRDAGAWAQALDCVMTETEPRRRQKIEEGRRWAERFTWDSAVDELESVCRRAAGSASSSRTFR